MMRKRASDLRNGRKKRNVFFREGRIGQWREVLTQPQIDLIVADHREQMARFGYWPPV
jgi:hypothetical protein